MGRPVVLVGGAFDGVELEAGCNVIEIGFADEVYTYAFSGQWANGRDVYTIRGDPRDLTDSEAP